ncbi:hypothetical protein MNB_SV-13-849 [hydrothermal vent metagenome]|uniref:Uncharacterized protein n=1 Tax=hydrothermal vent metagenome TaxID=652676 RepID=A0A1W1D008_9ZZZZ
MGQEKRDFDFTVELFDSFFSRKKIQKRLSIINEKEITGWEIWWQVEFATYLSTKDERVSEWYREWKYPLDKRVSSQSDMFIDFLIRQKYAKKNNFIALELKQHIYAKTCIRNMLEDTDKVFSMRKSASDIRSFWNIGIYKESMAGGDEAIKQMILEYHNLDTQEEFIQINKIGDTGFYYLLF